MADKLRAIDIDATPVGPKLDALVAEMVMGWENIEDDWNSRSRWLRPREKEIHFSVEFSTDANCVREVEAEIKKQGLGEAYVEKLLNMKTYYSGYVSELDLDDLFKIVAATPEQKCRAALGAARQELLDG